MYYEGPAGRPCLRFNEAQALAWRFSVSSWGCSTTLTASVVYKPEYRTSPQVLPIRPASDRLPGLPRQGHVRSSQTGERRSPRSPPGTGLIPRPGRGSRPTGAGASPHVPSRGVEESLLLVPFLLILVCLGIGVTVAEGPAAPLALTAARTVTEAVGGRVATTLRPPGRAPSPRTRLLLGSGSPRVAQHSAAQRAHGSRLAETSGSAPQGAQRKRSPAMARPPPPAST